MKTKQKYEEKNIAAESEDKKFEKHTNYHEMLIKNIVWNRQRLQST
jgi:hypothetical protein